MVAPAASDAPAPVAASAPSYSNVLSLLNDRMFSVRTKSTVAYLTLPEVFAALCSPDPIEFTALRPHQQQPWHAFLVQVGAMAAMEMQVWPGNDVSTWRKGLLELTFGEMGPWCLLRDSDEQAGFMQPPLTEGLTLGKSPRRSETPDARDILVTAKSWDVKQATIRNARPEHWVYALVTLQTTSGYLGAGNYGTCRIKSGFASRPGVTMANDLTPNSMFCRDASVAMAEREALNEKYGFKSEHLLLWQAPWDGETAIPLKNLDVLSVEVCRFVRMRREGDRLVCLGRTSSKARVDAGDASGVVGDIWMPIDRKNPKKLTGWNITPQGITYRLVQQLLLDPERFFQAPSQGLREADRGTVTFVVRGVGRDEGDNGNTCGYHEFYLEIPNDIAKRWDEKKAILAARSIQQVETARNVHLRCLKPALCLMFQGGRDSLDLNDSRVEPALASLEKSFDTLFFQHLWTHIDDSDDMASSSWDQNAVLAAHRVLVSASENISGDQISRVRAFAKASGMFRGSVRKNFASCRLPLPPPSKNHPSPSRQGTVMTQSALAAPQRTATSSEPTTAQTETSDRNGLYGLVDAIQRYIKSLSKGDRAELHRMDPDDVSTFKPAFWRIVMLFLQSDRFPMTPDRERRWAIILKAMGKFEVFHNPRVRFGVALQWAEFSELRFTQMLRSGPENIGRCVQQAVTILAQKSRVGFDFADIAWLVLTKGGSSEEKVNRRLSMDFYRQSAPTPATPAPAIDSTPPETVAPSSR